MNAQRTIKNTEMKKPEGPNKILNVFGGNLYYHNKILKSLGGKCYNHNKILKRLGGNVITVMRILNMEASHATDRVRELVVLAGGHVIAACFLLILTHGRGSRILVDCAYASGGRHPRKRHSARWETQRSL